MKNPRTKYPKLERAIRRLQREIRRVKTEDWTGKTEAGNVERDRYLQGLDSALVILRCKP